MNNDLCDSNEINPLYSVGGTWLSRTSNQPSLPENVTAMNSSDCPSNGYMIVNHITIYMGLGSDAAYQRNDFNLPSFI